MPKLRNTDIVWLTTDNVNFEPASSNPLRKFFGLENLEKSYTVLVRRLMLERNYTVFFADFTTNTTILHVLYHGLSIRYPQLNSDEKIIDFLQENNITNMEDLVNFLTEEKVRDMIDKVANSMNVSRMLKPQLLEQFPELFSGNRKAYKSITNVIYHDIKTKLYALFSQGKNRGIKSVIKSRLEMTIKTVFIST